MVLVDVCMPELDGFELAAIIREHPRYQKTAIIFVSAVHLTELDRLRGYECGAVDYIPVPVVPEILRAKVARLRRALPQDAPARALERELESRVRERTAELEASTARLLESQEQLRDADRRKDEFLAMLAHELRNPLAPIRTAVQLMRFKELPDEQRTRARDVIERQVDQLVRLIDDLLDVSRITRGMITLHREPIELTAVIARAVETTRPLIDAHRQELVVALPPRALRVEGDGTRLAQVIGNLLNNAAKYTPDGGRIRVQLHAEEREAVITVNDTGIGIPPEMLGSIFDLFTQVDRALDRAHGGLGIGLALVRRSSRCTAGRSARRAPASTREPRSRSGSACSPRSARRRRTTPRKDRMRCRELQARDILVVDDNEDAAALIALLLKLAGQEVRTANGGAEALALAAERHPDVVFLDLAMPGLNGYETARRIRQEPWGREVTLIALSGWGQRRDRALTAEAGFSAHLVKPVSEEQLLSVLADLAPPRAAARA